MKERKEQTKTGIIVSVEKKAGEWVVVLSDQHTSMMMSFNELAGIIVRAV